MAPMPPPLPSSAMRRCSGRSLARRRESSATSRHPDFCQTAPSGMKPSSLSIKGSRSSNAFDKRGG